MSMRTNSGRSLAITPISEIPCCAPRIPGEREFENYHGSTFQTIQEKINEENRLSSQRPPNQRLFRCGDGWYRYDAGKPVRLTDEELKRLGVK